MEFTLASCPKCSALNKIVLQSISQKKPVCGKCGVEIHLHGFASDLRSDSFHNLIQKATLPVVVDCWAPWCGPCRSFAPTFEQTSLKLASKFIFAKLNTEEEQQLSGQLNIRGIPTLIVFKNGKEVTRQSGAMPGPMFEQWLNSIN